MPFLQFDDSSATVEYTPKSSDNGKYLRCRGVNPHLADEAVEDQWKISVHGQLWEKQSGWVGGRHRIFR